MNQNQMYATLPEADPVEVNYLTSVSANWTDDQRRNFFMAYSTQRVKANIILITGLVGGLLGVAGIHRFILGQIGMGILYLFTGGLCLVGTIIDAVNYKKLTAEYNMDTARKIMLQMGLTA
jgi:TM2 domain-containing membrane protein YozV